MKRLQKDISMDINDISEDAAKKILDFLLSKLNVEIANVSHMFEWKPVTCFKRCYRYPDDTHLSDEIYAATDENCSSSSHSIDVWVLNANDDVQWPRHNDEFIYVKNNEKITSKNVLEAILEKSKQGKNIMVLSHVLLKKNTTLEQILVEMDMDVI